MAFNGSGVFSRLYNWVTEQASSPIEIAKLDAQEDDFATAFNNCLTRDGQGKPSAHIDWNAKKITNLATPTSSADAATKAYVDTGAFPTSTATGTLTGCTTSPTVTVTFQKINKLCMISVPAVTATSNSTSMTITVTFPTGFAPSTVKTALSFATDNGVKQLADVNITDGVLAFYITPFNGTTFTNSGTKGLSVNATFVYYVD